MVTNCLFGGLVLVLVALTAVRIVQDVSRGLDDYERPMAAVMAVIVALAFLLAAVGACHLTDLVVGTKVSDLAILPLILSRLWTILGGLGVLVSLYVLVRPTKKKLG